MTRGTAGPRPYATANLDAATILIRLKLTGDCHAYLTLGQSRSMTDFRAQGKVDMRFTCGEVRP